MNGIIRILSTFYGHSEFLGADVVRIHIQNPEGVCRGQVLHHSRLKSNLRNSGAAVAVLQVRDQGFSAFDRFLVATVNGPFDSTQMPEYRIERSHKDSPLVVIAHGQL